MIPVLLLSDAGGASLVSAAVAALVVIFLTLPMVFLLAEHAQRRRAAPASPAPASPPRKARAGPLEIVASDALDHDFEDEPLPRTLGHVPPDTVVDAPLSFAGHVQVGERARLRGGLVAGGSVALAPGAVIEGALESGGHVHVARSARVAGSVRAPGDVRCQPYARVGAVAAGGRVVLMEGATVEGELEASEVERPLQLDRDAAARLAPHGLLA